MIDSMHRQEASSAPGSFSLPAIYCHFPFYQAIQARLQALNQRQS